MYTPLRAMLLGAVLSQALAAIAQGPSRPSTPLFSVLHESEFSPLHAMTSEMR